MPHFCSLGASAVAGEPDVPSVNAVVAEIVGSPKRERTLLVPSLKRVAVGKVMPYALCLPCSVEDGNGSIRVGVIHALLQSVANERQGDVRNHARGFWLSYSLATSCQIVL